MMSLFLGFWPQWTFVFSNLAKNFRPLSKCNIRKKKRVRKTRNRFSFRTKQGVNFQNCFLHFCLRFALQILHLHFLHGCVGCHMWSCRTFDRLCHRGKSLRIGIPTFGCGLYLLSFKLFSYALWNSKSFAIHCLGKCHSSNCQTGRRSKFKKCYQISSFKLHQICLQNANFLKRHFSWFLKSCETNLTLSGGGQLTYTPSKTEIFIWSLRI